MNINIQSIPPEEHRYDTAGDWWIGPRGELEIRVSNNLTKNEQFLIALHELVEVWLCQSRNISQQVVDDFDLDPAHQGDFEPGDLPDAPYRREHRFAMLIEHLMAQELGMLGYGSVT